MKPTPQKTKDQAKGKIEWEAVTEYYGNGGFKITNPFPRRWIVYRSDWTGYHCIGEYKSLESAKNFVDTLK